MTGKISSRSTSNGIGVLVSTRWLKIIPHMIRSYHRCCCINEPVIFSHLKEGEWLKICSDRDDFVPLIFGGFYCCICTLCASEEVQCSEVGVPKSWYSQAFEKPSQAQALPRPMGIYNPPADNKRPSTNEWSQIVCADWTDMREHIFHQQQIIPSFTGIDKYNLLRQ